MNDWINKFALHRIGIAERLADGACDAGYPEAVILLLAVLSGIASLVWPGERIDRKRFVELLVTYCKPTLQTQFISTAMLVQEFARDTDPIKRQAADSIRQKYLPPHHALIITGDDADGMEDDLLIECPQLSKEQLRQFSYAHLLYREARCGLVHNYSLGKFATSRPMTDRKANVSYVNVTESSPSTEHYKQICFHFDWMKGLVRSAAEAVNQIASSLPLPGPQRWWIEG
ncbi:MAG: hypothetical protein V1873_01890 [Verrucomicrobiota bacterium]